MASEKISQLPVTTTSTNGDLYTLVQGGVNKSITFTALQAAIALTPSSGITQLTGDVSAIGPGVSAATVNSVGGQIASAIAAATVAANAATFLDTPSTIVARDAGGNFSAGTVTASLVGNVTGSVSGSSSSFTGSLGGDVTGTQSATTILSTVVTGKLLTNYTTGTNTAIGPSDSILGAFEKLQAQITGSVSLGITNLTGDVSANGPGSATATVNSVGGQTAANVAIATIAANAATSSDTPSTIVKRDGSGNFSAGTISAIFVGGLTGNVTGNLTGNVTGNVSGSSATFTGNLSGDVTGTQSATVVSFVGGQSAAAVNTSVLATEAATNSNVFSTIVKRDSAGNFSATTITSALIGNVTGNVTGNVSGSAGSFTGSLSGDVTGTQGATVVSLVGGESAAAVAASVLATQAATNLDTASTIVKRDASGNFSAGTITANLTGNASGSSSSFTGSLSGDVSGTQNATVISVGAVTDTKASLADKPSIGVVATTNQALTGLPTIDGVVTTSGMLVLLAAQSTPSQNGPWVAQGGAWARPTWYPSGGTTQAFQFITAQIRQGVAYQGTTWVQTAAAPITIDTTTTSWLVIPFALSGSTVTGILPNANTTATNLDTPNTIVERDGSGNFSAGTITAVLNGTATNITATTNSTLTTLSALTTASALTITGTQVTGFTQGSVLFANTSGQIAQDNSQFYWDDTNHALGIGTIPSTLAVVDVVNNSGTTKTVQATGYGGTVGFRGRYANGTLTLPTAATAGNVLNLMSGRGYGTSQFAVASTGVINIVAGETFTNTSNATYISVAVTPTGSVTSAEAMRINSTGNVLIGTTVDNGTDKFQVNGSESIVGNAKIATAATSVVTLGGTSSTAVHQVNGGTNYTTNTITSNYTVDSTTTDYIIYPNSTSSAITITLPAPTNGRTLEIYDFFGNAATNNITVVQHGAETISGLTRQVIATNYGGMILTSNGTNWSVNKIPTSGSLFLTSGTTYTTPVNTTPQTRFKFTLIGGGGGGSAPNAAADHGSCGGAGGGLILLTSGLSPSTSYTISVGGAGSAGAAGAVGGNGGNTTLVIGATTYTAAGGSAAATTTGNGGAGGTATNGSINIVGQNGGGGATVATSAGTSGGNSPFGFGLGGAGIAAGVAAAGNAATGYGGGGGGSAASGGNSGGPGTGGCILVEWSN